MTSVVAFRRPRGSAVDPAPAARGRPPSTASPAAAGGAGVPTDGEWQSLRWDEGRDAAAGADGATITDADIRRENRARARAEKRKPGNARQARQQPREPSRKQREQAWRKAVRDYANQLWSDAALPPADRVWRALGDLARRSLRVTARTEALLDRTGPGVSGRTLRRTISAGIRARLWRYGDPKQHPGERTQWLYIELDRDLFAAAWRQRLSVAGRLLDQLLAMAYGTARKAKPGEPIEPFGAAAHFAQQLGCSVYAVQCATTRLRGLDALTVSTVIKETNGRRSGVRGAVTRYHMLDYPTLAAAAPEPPSSSASTVRPAAAAVERHDQAQTEVTAIDLQTLRRRWQVCPDYQIGAYRVLLAKLPTLWLPPERESEREDLILYARAITTREVRERWDVVIQQEGAENTRGVLDDLLHAVDDPEVTVDEIADDWRRRAAAERRRQGGD